MAMLSGKMLDRKLLTKLNFCYGIIRKFDTQKITNRDVAIYYHTYKSPKTLNNYIHYDYVWLSR